MPGKPQYAYDDLDDMLKVKSMQKKFRDSFGGSALNANWWDVVANTGGMTPTVTAGELRVATGVTANAEYKILSKEIFTIPVKLNFGMTLSQRIANQSFEIGIESVDANGVPDGLHKASFVFDGATATNAIYRVSHLGQGLDSGASSIITTASGGMYEIEPFVDEVWFHSRTMDVASARANSYVRHRNIPDPNKLYKIFIRVLNGAVAPASTTTLTLPFISCADYAELTAEITAGRGQSSAGQAIAVAVTTVPTTAITLPAPTQHFLNSAATTNATSIKASAGTVYNVDVSNTGAAIRFVKLYNKASAPTVGTDVPVLTIPVAANAVQSLNLGAIGVRFSLGIAVAITAGAADTDTAVIGASEVKVATAYI